MLLRRHLYREMSHKQESKFVIGKFACLSILLCVAVIMGYLEALIPIPFVIPGIKLGLANYVTVIVLYVFRTRESYILSVLRVFIIGFLFMNLTMILYSLAGTVCSVTVMAILKKSGKFSLPGVSAAGGIAHNMAQLVVAYFMIPLKVLFAYIPWLIIAGTVAGLLVGFLAKLSLPGIRRGYHHYFENR